MPAAGLLCLDSRKGEGIADAVAIPLMARIAGRREEKCIFTVLRCQAVSSLEMRASVLAKADCDVIWTSPRVQALHLAYS